MITVFITILQVSELRQRGNRTHLWACILPGCVTSEEIPMTVGPYCSSLESWMRLWGQSDVYKRVDRGVFEGRRAWIVLDIRQGEDVEGMWGLLTPLGIGIGCGALVKVCFSRGRTILIHLRLQWSPRIEKCNEEEMWERRSLYLMTLSFQRVCRSCSCKLRTAIVKQLRNFASRLIA